MILNGKMHGDLDDSYMKQKSAPPLTDRRMFPAFLKFSASTTLISAPTVWGEASRCASFSSQLPLLDTLTLSASEMRDTSLMQKSLEHS